MGQGGGGMGAWAFGWVAAGAGIWARRALGLAAAWAAAGACAPGQVATNTSTSSAAWEQRSPGSFSVYLSQIDTNAIANFGSLLSIRLGLDATNTADVMIENWDPSKSNDVRVTVSAATAAGNGDVDLEFSRSYTHFSPLARTNLAPNTGTNWSGPDTVFFEDLSVSGAASNLITSGFASLYFGAGSFEVVVYTDASFGQSGTASLGASYSDLRSLGVARVSYTYTQVPEARGGAAAALAAGAMAAAWARRRRRD